MPFLRIIIPNMKPYEIIAGHIEDNKSVDLKLTNNYVENYLNKIKLYCIKS